MDSYEFGPYRLMPSERLLLRDGEPVPLTPKAFDTLVALVRRAGRLADKEDLLKEVWPDSFVEESNLTQNIFALRRALGPAANDKLYIETVPKRGYRFVAPVAVVNAGGVAPEVPEPSPPPSPALPQPPSVRARWTAKHTLALLSLAVVIGAGAALTKMWRAPSPAPAFSKMKLVRLTTSGNITNVAISPDGKYVAHAVRQNAEQSLWVRQTATDSVVRIVAPENVGYVGLTFSPDSNYIYYNVSSRGMAARTLYRVPALGGTPMKVMENLRGGAVSLSPDGTQFAFIRLSAQRGYSLMIANADGSAERILASYDAAEDLDATAWSPDGKRIAFAVVNPDSNDTAIVETQIANGSTRPVTSQRWLRIIKLAWMPDGRGLLLLATPGEGFVYQIWHLPYPDGAAARVTNDLNNYASMSLAADAVTLAAVAADTQANIWVAPDDDAGRMRAVTHGAGRVDVPTDWTPDGRIVYHSTVNGGYDIWITPADGGSPQQLTRDMRINQGPVVSPDGSHIVFLSDRTGAPHLWRMNLDGSRPRQLTFGPLGEQNPRFSPDGRWILYRTSTRRPTSWRIPAGGGDPVQITDKVSYVPTVSPDGRSIAYLYQDENAPLRIALAPFDGGAPIRTFPYTASPMVQRLLRFTRDGRAIAFIDTVNGVSNIFAQPIDGGDRVRLTDFTAGRMFGFAWSRDGRQLAVSRGSVSSDVVLIKDFR